MICELCGNTYKTTCMRCAARIKAWGLDGTTKLIELSKRIDDITAEELLEFTYNYYMGKVHNKRNAIGTLKIALRVLDYKGNFIGRITRNGNTYKALVKRAATSGKRWRLRKDKCEMCPSDGTLMLHHIIPIRWGGSADESNCITLCKECHQKIHRKLRTLLSNDKILEYLKPHKDEIEKLARQSLNA